MQMQAWTVPCTTFLIEFPHPHEHYHQLHRTVPRQNGMAPLPLPLPLDSMRGERDGDTTALTPCVGIRKAGTGVVPSQW